MSVEDSSKENEILIAAGEFIRGTSEEEAERLLQYGGVLPIEKPQRKIYLDAFYIDKYPVTNEMFAKLIKVTGYRAEGTKFGTWERYAGAGKEKHPVVSVSWNDIMAYCRWAGKRLPTEAEWEKAARGTDGRLWPWGNGFDPTKCNSKESGIGKTTPVDKYTQGKSPYDCFDMVGNIWELVQDWLDWDINYYMVASDRNPKGPYSGVTHVMRGGAFSTLPVFCRCASRIGPDSSTQFDRVGFRCARSYKG